MENERLRETGGFEAWAKAGCSADVGRNGLPKCVKSTAIGAREMRTGSSEAGRGRW